MKGKKRVQRKKGGKFTPKYKKNTPPPQTTSFKVYTFTGS